MTIRAALTTEWALCVDRARGKRGGINHANGRTLRAQTSQRAGERAGGQAYDPTEDGAAAAAVNERPCFRGGSRKAALLLPCRHDRHN